MSSNNHIKDCILLRDKLCKRLYFESTSSIVDKSPIEYLRKSFMNDDAVRDMEQLLSSIGSPLLSMLDEACPDLSKNMRNLAILLFLQFSKETIAFLTDRDNLRAVGAAIDRLRKHVRESQSEHCDQLLKYICR